MLYSVKIDYSAILFQIRDVLWKSFTRAKDIFEEAGGNFQKLREKFLMEEQGGPGWKELLVKM